MTHGPVTLPVIRALLDTAERKEKSGGVLGVRARPQWSGPEEFEHSGRPVRVVTCESALAVREALLERGLDRWIVVLTDRDEQDLGVGITAHLSGQRLRQPDPWEAVRERFAATRLDHRLLSVAGSRDLAIGLLALTPADGWAPAPGGLLTREHALGAVAAHHLGASGPAPDLDVTGILGWTTRSDATTRLANARSHAGDALVDEVVSWLAQRTGAIEPVVSKLVEQGRLADTVPLGLAARCVLATPRDSGPRALLRKEVGATAISDAILLAWAGAAEAVTRQLLDGDTAAAARVLARADVVLRSVEAGSHAGASSVLPAGLSSRLGGLGEALRTATRDAPARLDAGGPDAVLADASVLDSAEATHARVVAHALAGHPDEVRVPRALAAVRLVRWLAAPVESAPTGDLPMHLARHRDADAWVDRAYSDVWAGVSDEALAAGLQEVTRAVRLRRAAHDHDFARALAAHTAGIAPAPDGSVVIEDLMSTTVFSLARQRPVLLVVADGMSMGVATEVVDDVVRRYASWQECLPGGRDRRQTALAVLPTVTEFSRTSLFCGALTAGAQQAERKGFAALTTAAGIRAKLFHKLQLDSSAGGFALAPDVAGAIDDAQGSSLVACVLNTIDDALDRSDPGGIAWSADTVKHLLPLLERARRAGRVVVLTSDHGHIVERRQGRQVPGVEASTNRWRPADVGPDLLSGEVLIQGERVLQESRRVVLAVDEHLRYGPLKAGYHGGAAPAEVVIPVVVLTPDDPPPGWRLAPPQSPDWWRGPVGTVGEYDTELAVVPAYPARRPDEPPTLFDDEPVDEPMPRTGDLAHAVLASATYREQRKRHQRAAIVDATVGTLLRRLLAAPGNRVDRESAAAALGVASVQLTGALSQVQRLLNVDQYGVVSLDADGRTVVLDVSLLREQFVVPA